MEIIHDIDGLRARLGSVRPAFVPTMGALHSGHASLIRKAAQSAAADSPVVVSIFVNPTQFGPNEDFSRYPRMLDADIRTAESAGANVIFAPDVMSMYPADVQIWIPPLPAVATQPKLEDFHRPTHFAGVCQVVARLFDIMQPSIAVFGEKDYQQLLVISAMVDQHHDRWRGLRIIAHQTVREPDGLAMSSRNAYLRPQDRDRALGLFRALRAVQQIASAGHDIANLEQIMSDILHEHGLVIDYATIRDAKTLMPLKSPDSAGRALIAARLGNLRLIDNLQVGG